MESLHIDIESIDKRIKEAEELIKKYPNCTAHKINLEQIKCFREDAIRELKRRNKNERTYTNFRNWI